MNNNKKINYNKQTICLSKSKVNVISIIGVRFGKVLSDMVQIICAILTYKTNFFELPT